MFKIQYASDLHLEFQQNGSFIKHQPLQPTGDVLVLAGDIGYLGDENYSAHPFWDWASDNYEQVIVIPGNHEFYKGFDIDQLCEGWTMRIRPNVCCYYNCVIPVRDDIELVATTLWGRISIQDAFITERSVSDFYRIMAGNNILSFERFNEEHDKCRAFLEKSVNASKAKHIIVATHHVPSYELTSPDFKGSPINGAFTVELGNYIADSRIEYWIYGHSHRNIDKTIGRTKCVSNQLGYVHHSEHGSFSPTKHLVIE